MSKLLQHKIFAIIIILLIAAPLLLQAQDTDPDIDEWEDYITDPYVQGDQFIVISLGTVFPIVFIHEGKPRNMNFKYPVGGGGSISYNYFLSNNFFTGGEIGIQFLTSIRGDSLFTFPFGVKAGYQFLLWKLEIPVSIGAGGVLQRFLSAGYFGVHVKGGAGIFYRTANNWSFGGTANWYWYPQWRVNDPQKKMDGNVLDLTLSARYHF